LLIPSVSMAILLGAALSRFKKHPDTCRWRYRTPRSIYGVEVHQLFGTNLLYRIT
jgi:hypothetical protein